MNIINNTKKKVQPIKFLLSKMFQKIPNKNNLNFLKILKSLIKFQKMPKKLNNLLQNRMGKRTKIKKVKSHIKITETEEKMVEEETSITERKEVTKKVDRENSDKTKVTSLTTRKDINKKILLLLLPKMMKIQALLKRPLNLDSSKERK